MESNVSSVTLRAADRFTTVRVGSTTRHCFSFGHHYDPGNVSFGPVVAVNDELVAPGGSFAEHPHAGLVIVTYVVTGSLVHQGISDAVVESGQVAVLRCGGGVVHAERNSGSSPLRFVQTWLATSSEAVSYDVVDGPVDVDGAAVRAGELTSGPFTGHLFVATGTVRVGDHLLAEGDSLRTTTPVVLEPAGATGVVVDLSRLTC